jgi:hypothetical protein
MNFDLSHLLRGWKSRLRLWKLYVDAFFLGAAMSWVMVPHTMQQRTELERIFALEFSASLLGLPLMPPAYALRLLPYFLPSLLYWRRMTAFDRVMEGADLRHIGH